MNDILSIFGSIFNWLGSLRKLIVFLGVILFAVIPVSAQSYSMEYPAYLPISGGAWCEANTSEGLVAFVVPLDYLSGYFGFSGSGYNVANVTSVTISGTLFSSGTFSYYGNPNSVQCRFTRMNTMEVYVPYRNSYGSTSYQWEQLDITTITASNIAFVDDALDRQNDLYRYDTTQKILILIFVLLGLLGFFKVAKRMWSA